MPCPKQMSWNQGLDGVIPGSTGHEGHVTRARTPVPPVRFYAQEQQDLLLFPLCSDKHRNNRS